MKVKISSSGHTRNCSALRQIEVPHFCKFRIAGKMGEYQHPLFFEAKDLSDREKDKIRRYFQKRRDSGGGDCGMIEKAGGNIYKISFKEKEGKRSNGVKVNYRLNTLCSLSKSSFLGDLELCCIFYRPGKSFTEEVSHHLPPFWRSTSDREPNQFATEPWSALHESVTGEKILPFRNLYDAFVIMENTNVRAKWSGPTSLGDFWAESNNQNFICIVVLAVVSPQKLIL